MDLGRRLRARRDGRREPADTDAPRSRSTEIEAALSDAIDQDQLVIYYQPIIHIPSGVLQGFEALVRWDGQDGRRLQAAEFVPVAESAGLIGDLDTWVLVRAADQLAVWNRSLQSRQLILAVNVSAQHVNDPRIRDDVAEALERDDLDSSQLVLEVTDTAQVDDVGVENLRRIRDTGVTLALDDIDAGRATASRAARLPVDIAKVDRRHLDAETRLSRAHFRSLVEGLRSQGVVVMAGGVERQDQLELVKEAGVEFAQGFALGRPMAAAEVNDQWRRFTLPRPPSETPDQG